MSLPELKNQQVRDLAYSCFSEPLVSDFNRSGRENGPMHCRLGLNDRRIAWLQQLDRSPHRLVEYLNQIQPRRLGLYHEALWHFFLRQDDDVELVAHNLQLIHGGKTIGEFDVIYRDLTSNSYVHLELAFKVYLQAPASAESDLSQWLGPNVNDRLDRKLEHMLNHQSRLSDHDAGRQMLQMMGIEHIRREISLRGYLLGRNCPDRAAMLPDPVNPDCLKGGWLPVSRVVDMLDQYQCWMPLSRLEWISPLTVDPGAGCQNAEFADYLHQHFEQSEVSIMIAGLGIDEMSKPNEAVRIMVTPDVWPDGRKPLFHS